MKQYKLLKDLPNAKAGDIYHLTEDGENYVNFRVLSQRSWDVSYPKAYVENNPEWFAFFTCRSSKEEVGWEIVAYKCPYFGNDDVIFTKNHHGSFGAILKLPVERVVLEEESSLKRSATIHSVRRKSDSLIFSVGDETNIGTIKSFQVNKTDMWVFNTNPSFNLHQFINLEPLPKRTYLFTTNEGTPVYDKDTFSIWKVDKYFQILLFSASDASPELHPKATYFSREENAKEYVKMNKPLLSVQECIYAVLSVFGSHPDITRFSEKIHNIAESKLK